MSAPETPESFGARMRLGLDANRPDDPGARTFPVSHQFLRDLADDEAKRQWRGFQRGSLAWSAMFFFAVIVIGALGDDENRWHAVAFFGCAGAGFSHLLQFGISCLPFVERRARDAARQ